MPTAPLPTAPPPRIRLLKMLTNFKIGGTERQVSNLVLRIDSSCFDLHLACFSNSGELQREIEHMRIPRPEFQISRLYAPKTFLQALRLTRYIRKNRIQIVHSYGFYPNVFAIPAARLAGAAIVASIRDTGDGLTPIQRGIQKLICRMANCVLVNAEAIRRTLIAQGYRPDNIVVIRNGINLPPFLKRRNGGELRRSLGLRHSLGLPPAAPVVLVFARLNQLKGVDYFLDAAALVAKSFGDVFFVIAGDGAHRTILEQRAAELGLKDRVRFTGFRTDVPDLLSEATLSVLPSLSEGLSNSLLESMAAGVPAIATRVGGNPEVIDDGVTGLLAPPRDARSLADAMCRLLGDPDLTKRFGEAGRRRVEECFSMERTVSETEQLYRRLVNAKTKILLVGPSPPPHGGISVHVEGTRRQLVRAGIRCEVLDTGRGSLGPAFACSLIGRALRGWRMQVHTNGHNRKSWLLTLLCGAVGFPCGGSVVTLHSGMAPGYLKASRGSRRLAEIACLLYSRVVCVSPAIRNALVDIGVPPDKVSVSPAWLPVDASAVHASAVPLDPSLSAWMDRHDPGCATTLFFRPEYGFDLLISALKGLRRRHPAVGCVVMGSGAGRAEAERTVREAGMEDAIRMTGDVDHETCLAIMARSQVFLRPALEDGDSISVREALALGIPVVASSVGTRPTGTILFRNGDIADLLEKIESALGLKRVGHAERRHAEA